MNLAQVTAAYVHLEANFANDNGDDALILKHLKTRLKQFPAHQDDQAAVDGMNVGAIRQAFHAIEGVDVNNPGGDQAVIRAAS